MSTALRAIAGPSLSFVVILAGCIALADLSEATVASLGLTSLVLASMRVCMAIAIVASGALLAIRMMDLLLWQRYVDEKGISTVPRLLVSLSRWIIWAIAAVLLATHLNGEPPLAIITTSGVLFAVIGLAVGDLISDIASGVVFSIDRPVSIGDHIRVGEGPILEVQDITWRAARLRNGDGSFLVVPNGALSRSQITNYGPGPGYSRSTTELRLPYHLTAEQVDPVLLGAVRSVALANGIEIEALVIASDLDRDGVVWELRYWIPNNRALEFTNLVRRAVLRQLRLAGIEPARARQDVLHAATPAPPTLVERVVMIIADLPIFATLQPADHIAIATRGSVETALAGSPPIVTHGESGDSMYVIMSGEVGIDIPLPNGESKRVAHLQAGAVFGEMSLLTGEARSATVLPVRTTKLFRIDRAALLPLFERYPELPVQLGEILTQRQLANAAAQQVTQPNAPSPPPRETLGADMARRIRAFFRLGN